MIASEIVNDQAPYDVDLSRFIIDEDVKIDVSHLGEA